MQPESTFYPSMVHADHTHIVCACVPDAAAVTWGATFQRTLSEGTNLCSRCMHMVKRNSHQLFLSKMSLPRVEVCWLET